VSWAEPYWSDTSTTAPANPWPGGGSATTSSGKSNTLIYGWSAGLGLDVELTENFFLRGEYEFIQFSQMKLNLNNARIGAGVKF
jgi:outer membrane immunogenic protein